MATFTVKFSCDNAAFDEGREAEISRILHVIASRIESHGLSGYYETIRDANGNDIGRYAIKNDDGTNFTGN